MIDGLNYVPDKYIVYEMKIRGMNTRNSTLRSRKNRLLKALQQEAEANFVEMIYHMPLAEDLKECAEFLTEVELEMTANLEANAIAAEYQLLYLKERVEGRTFTCNPIRKIVHDALELVDEDRRNGEVFRKYFGGNRPGSAGKCTSRQEFERFLNASEQPHHEQCCSEQDFTSLQHWSFTSRSTDKFCRFRAGGPSQFTRRY